MNNDDPRILALPDHPLRGLMIRWALYGQRGTFEGWGVAKYMGASPEHHAAGSAILKTRWDPAYVEQRSRAWAQYLRHGPERPPLEPDHPAILALPEHKKRADVVRWATENPNQDNACRFLGPYYMESPGHREALSAVEDALRARLVYPDGR